MRNRYAKQGFVGDPSGELFISGTSLGKGQISVDVEERIQTLRRSGFSERIRGKLDGRSLFSRQRVGKVGDGSHVAQLENIVCRLVQYLGNEEKTVFGHRCILHVGFAVDFGTCLVRAQP